jgi:DNA-binding NarL/FixJ family response regulator
VRTEWPALRILLVEEHPRNAELIPQVLRRHDPTTTVHTVGSRAAMVAAMDVYQPDAVIVEHGTSDLTALDALRLIQSHRPTIPLILVSGTMGDSVTRCLKAGAADFVHQSELARLEPAVRTAIQVRAPLRRLSQRQCTVLQRLASGESTRGIAEALGISIKTIETHRAELMKRLGIHDVAGLVRYAVLVGLVAASD